MPGGSLALKGVFVGESSRVRPYPKAHEECIPKAASEDSERLARI